ncbi:GNAT family N-acetyltransferase [Aeromonas schubertii]|uniref:GNAT family N-acetyltransferase n=1 Tax=Aeromonas schubertii TaxID=652 RepID=UPI0038B622D9
MLTRNECPGDIATIDALTRAAFATHPHSRQTEHCIVAALRASGRLTHSLVAEEGGELLGHVALSPLTLSSGQTGWFGLGPISVWPSRQGGGIGSALMSAAIQALQAEGAAGIVLVGEPDYYGRFGFVAAPTLQLPGLPPEYLLALPLAGRTPNGAVQFDPAFDASC